MIRVVLLLSLFLVYSGCLDKGQEKLVIGLHESMGTVNPLGWQNRPSLAAQRLQLPALVEFLGRMGHGSRIENRYRLVLVDTTQGAIDWNHKRRNKAYAKLVLKDRPWYDPEHNTKNRYNGYDVQYTVERIKQATEAWRMTYQKGRLPLTPFLSFVAQAIERIEVDPDDERTIYVRFADHVLGPTRLHALTFRVLPKAVLENLPNDKDVFVTATPYIWDNWREVRAATRPGRPKPSDTVLRFKAVAGAPDRTLSAIELRTTQDLRSYKMNLESGAFGLAFGLPQKPGEDLDLAERFAWKVYDSSDVWVLIFNCKNLVREDRRALVSVLTHPESRRRFVNLLFNSYPGADASRMRQSVFSNDLIERYPRVRDAIKRQAETFQMPLEQAVEMLKQREFRFVYSYGMGDQFEPDVIAATVKNILGSFGVTLRDDRLEFRDFMDALQSGTAFELALYKFSGVAQLPEDFDLGQILPMEEERIAADRYSVKPGPNNYFHFADSTLFKAMLALHRYPRSNEQGEIDQEQLQERQQAIVDIDRIVREQAIGLFLFSPSYYWFYDKAFDIDFDESRIIGGKKLPTYRE